MSLGAVSLFEAVECMVVTLSGSAQDVVLCSTVFGDYVGPGDAFVLDRSERCLPSAEVLFYTPRMVGAREVLIGSRSYGDIRDVGDADVRLFQRLRSLAKQEGIAIVDHVLVRDNMFRLMSECEDIWHD